MFSSIRIAMILLIIGGAGGGFLYVKNLKANLAISEANNAKLEQSVESQKVVIEQMQKDFKAVQEANANLNKLVNTLNGEIKMLDEKFNKINGKGEQRDLGDLAIKKSKAIERILNNGSVNAKRCFEIAMGAELTEKEKNATKKSEINPECPSIANPKYIPYAN
jgi:archaellum component FlaF (FlaF/FlaG flagellin family)